MNKSLSIMAGILLIGIIIGISIRQIYILGKPSFFRKSAPLAEKSDNPFEYSLGSLGTIDSALVGYREVKKISLSFTKPQAISVGGDGFYYAAGDCTIQVLDSSGSILHSIETGEAIQCLAFGESKNLYAGSFRKISVFSDTHTRIHQWEVGSAETYITAVAEGDQDIFVADAGLKVLWKFNREGHAIGKIGLKDSLRGIPGLVVPSPYMDLVLGFDGSLWVANPGRNRVENYRSNGDLLTSWGSAGGAVESFCGCCNPIQMALLSDGSFVTAEKGILRVKIYDPAGRFRTIVAPPVVFNAKESNLDLAVDQNDNILVLDSYEKQIRMFAKK